MTKAMRLACNGKLRSTAKQATMTFKMRNLRTLMKKIYGERFADGG
jgi:hypothetical protein